VEVLAVWEPILPTDRSAPGAMTRKRLRDRRVRQFWDPDHFVAMAIKKVEASGTMHPDCCVSKGFLWDLNMAYAPGVRWGDNLPEPVLINGPVVKTTTDFDALLANAK
jgi:hypothetical protein